MINFFKALWPNEADSGFEMVLKISFIMMLVVIGGIFGSVLFDLIWETFADG